MKKIILTGGGTAGHVTPLLALMPELEKIFDEIHFIGRSEGVEHDLAAKTSAIYHSLDCARLERNKFFCNLKVPFSLAASVRKAKKLLAEIEPDVIFSKGGYVALPVALAAKCVPLIVHESDTSIGLANKLSVKNADIFCSSFPLPSYKHTEIICTGSPLRSSIYSGNKRRAMSTCGFDGSKKVLLITGGSLGSEAINNAVYDRLSELLARYDIIHLCGKAECRPRQSGYYPISFTENIADFFAAADLALTRAGGNTLFELGALHKPMLIVPLPKGASRGDQVVNAAFFEKHGLAHALDQSLIKENLVDALLDLEKDSPALIKNMKNFKFDGTKEIIKLIGGFVDNNA